MNNRSQYQMQLDNLLTKYLQELRDTSDEDVLNGEEAAVSLRAKARLEKVKSEIGKQRIAKARAHMHASNNKERRAVSDISIEEAKRYIQQAANDTRFTLAARQLNDMQDEDVIRLYQQICTLKSGE